MTKLRCEEHTGTHLHAAGTEVEVLVLEREFVRVRRVGHDNEQAFYTRRDNLIEDGGGP